MKPDNFLKYSGEHYVENRKKWSARLKKMGMTFSEDIFNDSVIRVYDLLQKHEVDDDRIEAFWYQSFLNNTKRDLEYSYHKRDDDVDVFDYLRDFPAEDRPILLEDIENGIISLNEIDRFLFIIYYLTDVTYEELEQLTGIKDMKYRLKKIRRYIKEKGGK
jgi:DNA-directed RNA polymerase specialized sigma24 family protein